MAQAQAQAKLTYPELVTLIARWYALCADARGSLSAESDALSCIEAEALEALQAVRGGPVRFPEWFGPELHPAGIDAIVPSEG